MTVKGHLQHSLLGKEVGYPNHYSPELLYAVPRQLGRKELGLTESAPFYGTDIWVGYELSWLDPKGKPQVACIELQVPCTSPHIIESKSLKLYLNSFNQERYPSSQALQKVIEKDLSNVAQAPVAVLLFLPDQWKELAPQPNPGTCLDQLDITIDQFQVAPSLLKIEGEEVEETLFTRLFKSKCPMTGQPDWANITLSYKGKKLCHKGLLSYLISFRDHSGFHEQCVERIYLDLQKQGLKELSVMGRFTRRGGLEINPYRSSSPTSLLAQRCCRQ